MRSRFNDEPLDFSPGPDKPGPSYTDLGMRVVLGLAIVGAGWFGVSWMMTDVSGDYAGTIDRVGPVQLTLIRRPAGMSGNISYGVGSALDITEGSLGKGQELSLAFARSRKWLDLGQSPRQATFSGRIEGKSIKGTLTEAGVSVPVTMVKNDLSSLYRRLQSHLPWVS